MNGYSGRQPNMANELENNILNVHMVMVIVTSLGGIGLVIEGMLLDWEFWVLPLIMIGIIGMWALYITQPLTIRIREGIYVAFILFLAVFHGVHYTSFFDVSLMSVLMMITLAGTGRKEYQDYTLIEYIVVVIAQYYLAMKNGGLSTDALTISKILLHIFTVVIVYNICRNYVVQSHKNHKMIEGYISEVQRTNEAMEDFLANISHEFRTPINVVTGLSSILLKENRNDNIVAINEAGLRLVNQIDDILDYNEIIGNRLNISEEEYMIASVVNDVVKTARPFTEKKHLDFIVDLDPDVPAVMNGDISRIKKMLMHLIANAVKFTEKGGLCVKVSSAKRSYGVNLDIEVSDTGKGMSREDIAQLSDILYQADKGRDRSTGGIGLGLTIVYGFAHAMGGFARIDSEPGLGTTVHLSIPQRVEDNAPCLSVARETGRCVVTYIRPEKYKIPRIRDFYYNMIGNLSRGLKIPVHSAGTHRILKDICEHMPVTHIFTGQDEYIADRDYLTGLSHDICVVVNTFHDFKGIRDDDILYIPNPIYGVPIVNILNAGSDHKSIMLENTYERPRFTGTRALIVDDEVMNLVVASGLFHEYGMITDTAESGKEAIARYNENEYDVVFMDHMMPEMDGVVAMKKIKETGRKKGRKAVVVALTANAVSGAREMLLSEGFDGFIAKPIDTGEFERVMRRVLPSALVEFKGGGRL